MLIHKHKKTGTLSTFSKRHHDSKNVISLKHVSSTFRSFLVLNTPTQHETQRSVLNNVAYWSTPTNHHGLHSLQWSKAERLQTAIHRAIVTVTMESPYIVAEMMESDSISSNFGRIAVNAIANEPSQLAGSTGSLCWKGDELYFLLKRTLKRIFLLKRNFLLKRTLPF